MDIALSTLKQAGVKGVMVNVWWGIAGRAGPGIYDVFRNGSLHWGRDEGEESLLGLVQETE